MPSRSSDRRAQPLRGLTVFVARPAGQARAIASRLRALGADPVALPTASLRATDEPEAAIAALGAAASAAAVVFVSPAAVRYAFRLLPALSPSHAIAVGPTTQRLLARHGIDAVVPARFDSEGVLALPMLQSVRGRTIVIVGAPGGRDAIRSALAARGATVEFAAVYRRARPRWTAAHRRAIERASSRSALVVSSSDALAVLAQLGGDSFVTRFRHRQLVVPSERVEAAARSIGFARIVRASSALPAALVDALVAANPGESAGWRPLRVW